MGKQTQAEALLCMRVMLGGWVSLHYASGDARVTWTCAIMLCQLSCEPEGLHCNNAAPYEEYARPAAVCGTHSPFFCEPKTALKRSILIFKKRK